MLHVTCSLLCATTSRDLLLEETEEREGGGEGNKLGEGGWR